MRHAAQRVANVQEVSSRPKLRNSIRRFLNLSSVERSVEVAFQPRPHHLVSHKSLLLGPRPTAGRFPLNPPMRLSRVWRYRIIEIRPIVPVPVGNSISLATDIESGDAPALCERFVA